MMRDDDTKYIEFMDGERGPNVCVKSSIVVSQTQRQWNLNDSNPFYPEQAILHTTGQVILFV